MDGSRWVEYLVLVVILIFITFRSFDMSLIDINALEADAEREVNEERARKAKNQLKEKLQQIARAKVVVENLEREKADLLLSISDGTN